MHSSLIIAFLLYVTLPAAIGDFSSLYTILTESTEGIKDCNGPGTITCRRIKIDVELVLGGGNIFIPEVNIVFEKVGSAGNVFQYNNGPVESLTIVLSPTKSVSASICLIGRVFQIVNCGGPDCHVLMEVSARSFKQELHPVRVEGTRSLTAEENLLLQRGREDADTVVETSVKVYYTAELAGAVSDVGGLVDLAIAETNAGYAASGVKIRLKLHCLEPSTVQEGPAEKTLYSFARSKETFADLRGSADMAILLVLKTTTCGIAFLDVMQSGQTIGLVQRSCAVGYFSFGHEIAHLYGARHNRETEGGRDGFGYGYLIRGNDGEASGLRTILAYSLPGFSVRVNRYSSSNATLTFGFLLTSSNATSSIKKSLVDLRLGDDFADNARLLSERRFLMANVGNEVIKCGNDGQTNFHP